MKTLSYAAIDGQWGPWSEWTEKVTVGNIVTLVRQRKCDNPEPKYEGKDCQGSDEEVTEVVKELHMRQSLRFLIYWHLFVNY